MFTVLFYRRDAETRRKIISEIDMLFALDSSKTFFTLFPYFLMKINKTRWIIWSFLALVLFSIFALPTLLEPHGLQSEINWQKWLFKQRITNIANGQNRDQVIMLSWAIWLPIVLYFVLRKIVHSEYTKTKDANNTIFEVTPASTPRNSWATGWGIVFILIAASLAAGGELMWASGPMWFGFLFLIMSRLDYWRPRAHRHKTNFLANSEFIETEGKRFLKEEIHRLIIRNAISNSIVTSFSVVVPNNLAGGLAGAGLAAAAAHKDKVSKVANSLELEAGGKAYVLAGGMDETTAFGLLKDVCKVIGFE